MIIEKALLHNYADDNILSAFTIDIDDVIEIYMDKSQKTFDWLNLNQMILILKQFKPYFFLKRKMPDPET